MSGTNNNINAGRGFIGNRSGQSTFGRRLAANTNLLQPGSQYYRINNALDILNASAAIDYNQAQQSTVNSTTATQVAALQTQTTTNTNNTTANSTAIASIQTTLTSLQNQINTINARLTAAGIP